MSKDNDIVYQAWRVSESDQTPMTKEGEGLAKQRWYGFKQGWEYAMMYMETGTIYDDYDIEINGK